MYICKAILMNNERVDVGPAFAKEDDAWNCVDNIMKQPAHPKMMWVVKGDDSTGHADSNRNSGC